MRDAERKIFRADALQRYIAGREKAVLPRFIAPPIFLFLWVALGLLTVGASIVLATQIPVYTSSPAVVAPHDGAGRDAVTVLVSLPPSAQGELRVGQSLVLTNEASGLRVAARIVDVVGSPFEGASR